MTQVLYHWVQDSILRTVRIVRSAYRAICGQGKPVVDIQDVHSGEKFDCVPVERLEKTT